MDFPEVEINVVLTRADGGLDGLADVFGPIGIEAAVEFQHAAFFVDVGGDFHAGGLIRGRYRLD